MFTARSLSVNLVGNSDITVINSDSIRQGTKRLDSRECLVSRCSLRVLARCKNLNTKNVMSPIHFRQQGNQDKTSREDDLSLPDTWTS